MPSKHDNANFRPSRNGGSNRGKEIDVRVSFRLSHKSPALLSA